MKKQANRAKMIEFIDSVESTHRDYSSMSLAQVESIFHKELRALWEREQIQRRNAASRL